MNTAKVTPDYRAISDSFAVNVVELYGYISKK